MGKAVGWYLVCRRGGSTALDFGDSKPGVLLIVGVNGGGKTTTIGKLAYKFVDEGATVGPPPPRASPPPLRGQRRLSIVPASSLRKMLCLGCAVPNWEWGPSSLPLVHGEGRCVEP